MQAQMRLYLLVNARTSKYHSYGMKNLQKGDEIVLSISNHHANIVPWQQVAHKTGAIIKYVY